MLWKILHGCLFKFRRLKGSVFQGSLPGLRTGLHSFLIIRGHGRPVLQQIRRQAKGCSQNGQDGQNDFHGFFHCTCTRLQADRVFRQSGWQSQSLPMIKTGQNPVKTPDCPRENDTVLRLCLGSCLPDLAAVMRQRDGLFRFMEPFTVTL